MTQKRRNKPIETTSPHFTKKRAQPNSSTFGTRGKSHYLARVMDFELDVCVYQWRITSDMTAPLDETRGVSRDFRPQECVLCDRRLSIGLGFVIENRIGPTIQGVISGFFHPGKESLFCPCELILVDLGDDVFCLPWVHFQVIKLIS
jgi:hypothetical protein